jgi:hypothetical protein
MNLKVILIVLILLSAGNCRSQVKDSITDCSKYHSVTGGIGMESLLYIQYKHTFYNRRYFHTNVIGGFGFAGGDEEGGLSPHRNIVVGISQNIGIRPIFLTIGIAPILNFYEHVTFINLNGMIGLKYEPKFLDGFTFEIGYLPTLYFTHKSDVGIPFYLGGGVVF